MYKVLSATLTSGSTQSPGVVVPGRLIGFTVNLATSSQIQLVATLTSDTPNAVVIAQEIPATAFNSGLYNFVLNPNMPTGNVRYAVRTPTSQAGDTLVTFIYEDSPALY